MLAYIRVERKKELTVTTQDRIIDATIELVNEKGYKGATTRAIADRAGVNEVTLFRHFGSKKGIVEAAIHKYSFDDLLLIMNRIDQQIEWDLQKDMQMFVREYQSFINKKRKIILISLKESGEFPELDKMIAHIPQAIKNKLKSYFSTMMDQGKMQEIDVDIIATNFMYMNIGYFMLKSRLSSGSDQISVDEFIHNNIELVIQSLR